MYYMLNLLFSYTDSSAQGGRFMEYVPPQTNTNLLTVSKAWLESAPSAPNPPDPNNPAHWLIFHKDAEHLSFSGTEQPYIWVRVADANQANEDFAAQILVLIARNSPNSNAPQPYSSPIIDPNSSRPLNSYSSALGTAPPRSGNNTLTSWVWQPGQATLISGPQGTKNKYTMLVGAWVQGSPFQTFSHDPDMNIDC